MRLLLIILLLIFFPLGAQSQQKVGIVLSGGGASGLAHIGMLKALEENNVPIDYITGTSIGAFVGGMYAAGYSPEQIIALCNSEQFRNLARGVIEDQYTYYFTELQDDASWVSIKFSRDTTWKASLPTNLISPVPLDYELMNLLAPAIAAANYQFDQLMIPFRCVASDIADKKQVVFSEGSLAEAVRASMSYPLYLKPITVDGKLLFDGGLYNNFPVDIMQENFHPDVVLGCNVSSNELPPSEDDVISQLRNMIVSTTDYTLGEGISGLIIEPNIDVGVFDFSNPQRIIDSGYATTIRQIDQIKALIQEQRSKEEVQNTRNIFLTKQKELIFEDLQIEGLNKRQSNYVRRILQRRKKSLVSSEELKPLYYRVFGDDKIKRIYPKAVINKEKGLYNLLLKVKKSQDLVIDFGGNFSSRPINQGFVGVKYNYLGNIGISLSGNSYFGRLYDSGQLKARFDFPIYLPFYFEPEITINRWNYFRSRAAFIPDDNTSFLIQTERFGGAKIGIPFGNKGKVEFGGHWIFLRDEYYLTRDFNEGDTADRTDFEGLTGILNYDRNTLNRKLYPNRGSRLMLSSRYIQGEERYRPGSTSNIERDLLDLHDWWQLKLTYVNYYKQKGILRLGLHAEAVYSTQSLFDNYSASVLRAPAFQPTPESKTLFLESFRAYQFAAIGHKFIFNIREDVDLRFEGYIFQPYKYILNRTDDGLPPQVMEDLEKRFTIAMAAAVYHSPLGPVSLSMNYYHNLPEISLENKTPLTFMFHFGYVIFNDKALK